MGLKDLQGRIGISHIKYVPQIAYWTNAAGCLYEGNLKMAAISFGVGGLATLVMHCADVCLEHYSKI